MLGSSRRRPVRFAPEEDLDYAANAFRTESGVGLRLDTAYSLFHLPLVNGSHPDVIVRDTTIGIENGRFHAARRSVVAFVSWDALDRSPEFTACVAWLRRASFSRKLAWESFETRKDRLHVTIASIDQQFDVRRIAACLPRLGPLDVKVGGVWAGQLRNTGRLYLPCYPRALSEPGMNVLQALQRMAGLPVTRFFGIGILNLTDHLTPEESHELVEITGRYRSVETGQYQLREICIVDTLDSLLNYSTVIASFPAAVIDT